MAAPPPPPPSSPPFTREELSGKVNNDLKEMMKKQGISIAGLRVKADFIKALLEGRPSPPNKLRGRPIGAVKTPGE